MTKIKMCGLFREEDIEAANLVKPEYIGFVFFKKSHRYVDKEKALLLKSKLDKAIKAVGVFVDEDISFIRELVDERIIDVVQLHGKEDYSYIKQLRESTGGNIPIIKAVIIKSDSDVNEFRNSFSTKYSADYYLLDSGMGSGTSLNWDLLKGLDISFFLAGGLSPENVGKALEQVNPFAIDVSSGIETDKVKDIDKMKQFASIVRNTTEIQA